VNKILTIARLAILSVLRKKDIYILFIISIVILILICSINVMGLGGITAYVKDIGLLFTWLFSIIMVTNIAGSTLQDEEKSGTIYSLLAKPINRKQLILGKWLGIFSISVIATSIFYIIVFLLVLFKGGTFPVYSLIQAMVLHFGMMSIIISYSLFFSARLNSDAATIISYVMTTTCFLIIPKIPELISSPASTNFSSFIFTILYNILPHFEILDLRQRLVHDFGTIPVDVFLTTILYSIFFTAIFLMFAWLAYRNKYFSRSERY
jgi:Cu-processing system permease protein